MAMMGADGAGVGVADEHADLHPVLGPAAVGRHQAAAGLGDHGVGRPASVRALTGPGVAVAPDGTVDQPGVALAQHLVAEGNRCVERKRLAAFLARRPNLGCFEVLAVEVVKPAWMQIWASIAEVEWPHRFSIVAKHSWLVGCEEDTGAAPVLSRHVAGELRRCAGS